jgi:hypothetical protein
MFALKHTNKVIASAPLSCFTIFSVSSKVTSSSCLSVSPVPLYISPCLFPSVSSFFSLYLFPSVSFFSLSLLFLTQFCLFPLCLLLSLPFVSSLCISSISSSMCFSSLSLLCISSLLSLSLHFPPHVSFSLDLFVSISTLSL